MPQRRESDDGHAYTRKRRQPEKDTDEYLRKRERNNVAVKKSRDKARQKQKETSNLVTKLRQENADLDFKVKTLSKELEVLRQIFLTQAAHPVPMDEDVVPEQSLSSPDILVKQEDISESLALADHVYCS